MTEHRLVPVQGLGDHRTEHGAVGSLDLHLDPVALLQVAQPRPPDSCVISRGRIGRRSVEDQTLVVQRGSSQANVKGSKNYAAVASPVVDQLLERLLAARTRDEQLSAGQALDRVLLWQHYIIPNWYLNYHRLAYRNRFAFVTTPPYTLGLSAWWLKPTENTQ